MHIKVMMRDLTGLMILFLEGDFLWTDPRKIFSPQTLPELLFEEGVTS